MQTYIIKCLECKGERTIQVHLTAVGKRIDWLERQAPDPPNIISGRERLDGEFGWQCACSNNTLLTKQERKSFSNPAHPKPQELKQVIDNLKPEPRRFAMVAA